MKIKKILVQDGDDLYSAQHTNSIKSGYATLVTKPTEMPQIKGHIMSNENMMLVQGDCITEMRKMDSNIIDLTVTSPPYDNLRTYAGTLEWNFDIFKQVANELHRITKDGGVVVWVVGDATINGSETGTSFRQALYFKEIGFNLHDTMIWVKGGWLE